MRPQCTYAVMVFGSVSHLFASPSSRRVPEPFANGSETEAHKFRSRLLSQPLASRKYLRSTRCSQKTRNDLRYFGMRRRPRHVERSANCLISADGAKYVRALSTDRTKGGKPVYRLIQLAM